MPLLSYRFRLGLISFALVAGVPASIVASSGAAAAPATVMTISADDPVNDRSAGVDGTVDIVSAAITQDRAAGIFSVKITFRSDPTLNPDTWIHAALGFGYGSGECYVHEDINGVARLKTQIGSPDARWSITAPTDISGPATKSVEGNTLTITSEASPLLKSSGFICMGVGTFGAKKDGTLDPERLFDDVFSNAKVEVADTTPAPPAATNGKPQAVVDRDGDAVPDSTDKCIDVPGAGTDGCPTTAAAKALKLGTKRLVVDRLVERTGAKCPVVVKATVTAKGRTLGKQRIGVIAKGSWCHVAGVVKLKKRAKKVRVVIAGTGIAPVKQVVTH